MANIDEAIRRMIFEYTTEGADKVMQTQEAVAASTVKTDQASLSLEKSFGNLERRYVETVRHQQDYAKVQQTVNAAVAQNPALQERANAVLAAAGQHFDNAAGAATKGGMAAQFFSRALSTIIGPAGLIGIAIAGVTAAVAYLVEKFQVIPAVLDAVAAALGHIGWDRAAHSVTEYSNRSRDVTAAAEAQKAALQQIHDIHPNISTEVAKQLQLLEAQLGVARARTESEKISAQANLDIVEALQQQKGLTEAITLASYKRAIAEENAAAAVENAAATKAAADAAASAGKKYNAWGQEIKGVTKALGDNSAASRDNARYTEAGTGLGFQSRNQQLQEENNRAIEMGQDAMHGLYNETKNVTDETRRSGQEIRRGRQETIQWVTTMNDLAGAARTMTQTLAEAVDNRLDSLIPQFAGQQFGLEITNTAALAATYRQRNLATRGSRSVQDIINSWGPSYRDKGSDPFGTAAAMGALNASVNDLTGSTDSLNATMQSALSPFYSQDPRTTKLGFRAGVTGNPDWMTGATNANPLVAVLGAGATAPGMADGGSFVVGGGYSANDNKMAVFPVASGEEVVVNRTKQPGAQVVNIDNRIMITGSVDADTVSQMKVSRYQQTQRMRAGLRG